MPLLQLRDASLAFGHIPLLEDVNLVINEKERVCLIGRNGTGKSSLLNVLSGHQPLDSGTVEAGDGIRIAKLAQEVPAAATETLYDTIAAGLSAEDAHFEEWDRSHRIEATLSRLNLPADPLMSESSGGIRRRAMLGQAIVSEPDLLLLDEPTNHLDIDSITALQTALLGFSGAVLFISHDRAFIDALATRIIELDRGNLTSYPGSYAQYQKQKAAELAAEAQENRKFDQVLGAEEQWIRQGIKARRTRNEGRARRLEAMRRERKNRLERQGKVKLALDASNNSGKIVLQAEHASFAYERQAIISDFSTTILRGDRVGVIGPNGSGKSTLLQLLLGGLTPTSGTVKQGTQLQIAYFDQERMQLQPDRSVRDNVADGSDQIRIGDKTQHVVGYLRDFLFPPERVNSPVKALSGGERNRLLLAKLFSKPANLLVLDEPTNDLDVETLELLEELLSAFAGTLILVSHDRTFLDQTVTSTLVLEGHGRVGEYVGGYSDWKRQLKEPEAVAETKRKPSGTKGTQATNEAKATKSAKPTKHQTKLSYKDERELNLLPDLIEKLEATQQALTATTSEPDFYQQDQSIVAETMKSLAAVSDELEQAYERWAALEAAKARP